MDPKFNRFGPAHLTALAAAPFLAAFLSHWPGKPVRRCLAVLLLVLELAWFFRMRSYGLGWSELLPLQLSDASILLAVYVAWTLNPWGFDVLYYWGLTAVPLAMLTPDLLEPFPAPDTLMFFALHGLVPLIVLYLLWSGLARPRPGSMWRSFAALNGVLIAALSANRLFGTNYMYLTEKPSQPSPLDYMGPWPVYIGAGEVVALMAFYLLSRLYPARNQERV